MDTLTAPKPPTLKWDKEIYNRAVESGCFDGRHVELIDGEIIQMSPMGNRHDVAVMLAAEALQSAFPIGQYVLRVQMGFDCPGDAMPEPDLVVVLGSARDFLRSKPSMAELVVEVAESSLSYDRATKAGLYAASLIPEYWVVNLFDSRLEVYRAPRIDTSAPHGYSYTEITTLMSNAVVTPLHAPQMSIRVADLLP